MLLTRFTCPSLGEQSANCVQIAASDSALVCVYLLERLHQVMNNRLVKLSESFGMPL